MKVKVCYKFYVKNVNNVCLQHNSNLSSLYIKVNNDRVHTSIFKTFEEKFITEVIKMITMSPPMLMVQPEEVDDSIDRIANTSCEPPLHYRRLVIIKNYFGEVSVEGKAGNKESVLRILSD